MTRFLAAVADDLRKQGDTSNVALALATLALVFTVSLILLLP
ncbi:MAG: hypothetical protein WA208_04070 [Thermoanaerobaculia bacterium]